jgi:hypothetical protein
MGAWVSRQRGLFDRGRLTHERVQRLETLNGWVWNAIPSGQRRPRPRSEEHLAKWQNGLTKLKAFVEREGHARVHKAFKTEDGFSLGIWAAIQRQKRSTGRLEDPIQQKELEALPGWSWSPQDERHELLWEEGFATLKQFFEREGHLNIRHNELEGDFRLGRWVWRQQLRYKTMDPVRIQRLEGLSGWVWKSGR